MLFRYARPLPQGQPSSLTSLYPCLLVYLSAQLWIITVLYSAVSLLLYCFFMHHLLAHLSLFISCAHLSISPFISTPSVNPGGCVAVPPSTPLLISSSAFVFLSPVPSQSVQQDFLKGQDMTWGQSLIYGCCHLCNRRLLCSRLCAGPLVMKKSMYLVSDRVDLLGSLTYERIRPGLCFLRPR